MLKKSFSNFLFSIIIISIIFNLNIFCIDDAVDPSSCSNENSNNTNNSYYNTITYKCVQKNDSNSNYEIENENIKCKYGYYFNTTINNCSLCEANTVSSGDRSKCVKCEKEKYNFITDENDNNVDIYFCNCTNTDEIVYAQIEFDKKGNSLEYQYCNENFNLINLTKDDENYKNKKFVLQSELAISNGSIYLKRNESNKIPINENYTDEFSSSFVSKKMSDEINNMNIPFSTNQPNAIYFLDSYYYQRGNYENIPSRDSDIVSYVKRPSSSEYSSPVPPGQSNINEKEFKEKVFNCFRLNDQKTCQYLMNECVLTLYQTDYFFCNVFKQFSNTFGLYLYYSDSNENNDDSVLYDTEKIQFKVNVGNTGGIEVDKLEYIIKIWDLEGNYEEKELKNELILCTNTYNDTEDFRSVGVTLVNECFLDPNKLMNSKMNFYELYLKIKRSNFEEYFPIPVIIENENNQREIIVNEKAGTNRFLLHKRFFLINNRYNFLGFAKTIKLKVRFQNKEYRTENRIYIPFLKIEYFAVQNTQNQNQDENKYLMLSFRSEYNMDERLHIIPSIYAIFYVLLSLTGIFVVLKMCIWSKIHTFSLSRDNYFVFFLINFFIYLFRYTGLFLFAFCWITTAYWYIFYKLQFRAYIFLPDLDLAYRSLFKNFNIVWGIGCCSFFLYMLSRVYDQLNYDVFFIDWEHDKDLLVNYNANNIHSAKYKGAWRPIHIANQFNILQKERTISISICFGFLIMLWYYHRTHWNQFAQMSPNKVWVNNSPESMHLRYFITTFILVITGLVQYFLRRILNLILIPLKKNEFLDLCSVANISVIILDDKLHGYYIHGQSPFGKADTNFSELIQFLEEERKGKIRGRGLTGDEEDNLQSYEIYLSNNMRDIYDDLYYIEVNQELNAAEENDRAGNQSRYPIFFRYIPKKLDVDKYYHLNNYMNTQLKNKIQQVASQSKIFVKERTLIERFLQLPPKLDLISANARELVFYKDPGMNFDNVCFTGMEIEWLIMVVYIFQMWCISLQKYSDCLPVAIFMTYLMEKVAFRIRIYYGEKNVARKAVVDNRFL